MLRRVSLAVLVLVLLLGAALPAATDDVPDDVRKWYEKAREYVGKGDLKKAFSAITKSLSELLNFLK